MAYKLTFEDGSEAYLEHHGIKGMKWGVWNAETKAKYGLKGVEGGGGGGGVLDEEEKDNDKDKSQEDLESIGEHLKDNASLLKNKNMTLLERMQAIQQNNKKLNFNAEDYGMADNSYQSQRAALGEMGVEKWMNKEQAQKAIEERAAKQMKEAKNNKEIANIRSWKKKDLDVIEDMYKDDSKSISLKGTKLSADKAVTDKAATAVNAADTAAKVSGAKTAAKSAIDRVNEVIQNRTKAKNGPVKKANEKAGETSKNTVKRGETSSKALENQNEANTLKKGKTSLQAFQEQQAVNKAKSTINKLNESAKSASTEKKFKTSQQALQEQQAVNKAKSTVSKINDRAKNASSEKKFTTSQQAAQNQQTTNKTNASTLSRAKEIVSQITNQNSSANALSDAQKRVDDTVRTVKNIKAVRG